MATGTVSSTATRPDQRCSAPVQDGARTAGIRPYISSAETSCTSASTKAPVASQTLAATPLENPATLTAKKVGSWTRP